MLAVNDSQINQPLWLVKGGVTSLHVAHISHRSRKIEGGKIIDSKVIELEGDMLRIPENRPSQKETNLPTSDFPLVNLLVSGRN